MLIKHKELNYINYENLKHLTVIIIYRSGYKPISVKNSVIQMWDIELQGYSKWLSWI